MDKKELSRLKAIWYQKLKSKGFTDLEDKNGNLKSYHSSRFLYQNQFPTFQAKQRYYQLAGQMLYRHKFESIRDRRIWDLHSQGWTQEEIADKVAISHQRVSQITTELEKHLNCEKDCCTRRSRK